MSGMNLLVSDHHGIYIPQFFATTFDTNQWDNLDPEDIAILEQGPDHELYWEAWDAVLSSASITIDGKTWYLSQDGDLWAYCEELMTDEEYEGFFDRERETA